MKHGGVSETNTVYEGLSTTSTGALCIDLCDTADCWQTLQDQAQVPMLIATFYSDLSIISTPAKTTA
jgi:hypothetical protein